MYALSAPPVPSTLTSHTHTHTHTHNSGMHGTIKNKSTHLKTRRNDVWYCHTVVFVNLSASCFLACAENHMNCDKPFDGNGGELAHSWTGGDIHFDEDENYRRDDPSGSGINLLKVSK